MDSFSNFQLLFNNLAEKQFGMIPASDLRLGNWLENEGLKGKVLQIMEHEIQVICKKDEQFEKYLWTTQQLEPIIPGPEILKKCGFVKHSLFPHLNAFHHKKHLFNINIVGNTYEISFGLIEENVALIHQKNIFLHQLQNLYYQLTNEELDIVF